MDVIAEKYFQFKISGGEIKSGRAFQQILFFGKIDKLGLSFVVRNGKYEMFKN